MPDSKQAEVIQSLIPLLQSHEAFTELPPEKVAEFANRAKVGFYPQGHRLTEQGQPAHEFFVVISGQLRAIDLNYEPPHLLNYHASGDIIGVRGLLRGDVRAATVEVVVDAVVAVYTAEDWDWLLSQHSRIRDYFENMERSFDERSLTDFPGRQWDEVVVAATKRHFLAFLANLTWPLTLLIVPVLFLLSIELLDIRFLSFITAEPGFATLVTVPFIVLAGLMALYQYLDWRNDDFIITTKRVILIERILFYGEERHEAPLTRIQDVTVKSHGLLDLFLDVDDIEIKTAGAGTIAVDNIPSAQELSQTILAERERAKDRIAAANTASIRELVAQRLNRNPLAVTTTSSPPKPKVVPGQFLPKLPKLPKFQLSYFWPKAKEIVILKSGQKSEQGILWRKHYYILLTQTILPLLIFIAALYLLSASFLAWPPFGPRIFWFIPLVLGLAGLGSFFWYVWEYDDWRRDIYIVTDTRIIDVESSAFRLHGEKQIEGNFDSVQNITYKIPNFFYKLLNLGDVVIETAGISKFTFERVLNPSSVQEEIFNRWDDFQRRRQEKTRDDTNKQIVAVLGEYVFLSQEANTLKRP